jgi:hypothetical protein
MIIFNYLNCSFYQDFEIHLKPVITDKFLRKVNFKRVYLPLIYKRKR